MPISIDGLATGLDTTSIIDGLMAAGRKQVDLLRARQDRFTRQQTAFAGIQAGLASLQGFAASLARPQNNTFDSRAVSSSNTDLVVAAATASATPGVYSLRVNAVAQAHQVASQGYDAASSAITQGTIEVRSGTSSTATITIDDTNDSLEGLATAINAANIGVSAAVISDGSDSRTQPFRLVLTSTKTGSDNAITITNGLANDAAGARRPEFGSTYTGDAVKASTYTGTSAPTSNAGAATYTGSSNTRYTFTVENAGTVGTDNGLTVSYTDSTGSNSGTITLNSSDADVFKNVAQGIQVKFSAGTLVAGETFTVDGFVPTVQQASNASVVIGSGLGAITVQNANNQIDGVITGLTLNLLAADSAKTVNLTVTNNVTATRKGIVDFVDSFNALMDFIDKQVRYDATTRQAGTLLGIGSATQLQDDVRRVVTDTVAGVNSNANRLSAIGITANSLGRLTVNDSKLDDVLNGRVAGITQNDVRRLFAMAGQSTSAGVSFVTGTVKTLASGSSPYQVDIDQAATQGAITATNALAPTTNITTNNNTLIITIDGKSSGAITLASGNYTPLAMAQVLQGAINANTELAGRQVAVTVNADKLVISSARYGLASEVTIGGGTSLATLGFAGSESGRGTDVVGRFIVNGVDETARGVGQILFGETTNANTADLNVRVTLSANQVVAGAEANLTITRGIASKLDVLLGRLMDPVSGRLKSIDSSYSDRVADVQESIDRQNTILTQRRDALVRQFAALERIVSELRSNGDFLVAQLNAGNNSRQPNSR